MRYTKISAKIENQGIIKDPVQCTQQGVVLTEVLLPLGKLLVVRKNHVVRTFLVVAAVNEVKEKPCVLLVKDTVTDFIGNQAGWFYPGWSQLT